MEECGGVECSVTPESPPFETPLIYLFPVGAGSATREARLGDVGLIVLDEVGSPRMTSGTMKQAAVVPGLNLHPWDYFFLYGSAPSAHIQPPSPLRCTTWGIPVEAVCGRRSSSIARATSSCCACRPPSRTPTTWGAGSQRYGGAGSQKVWGLHIEGVCGA